MRLTKRQLKRIIREEYSRLKRKGLIRETRTLNESYDVNDVIDEIQQALDNGWIKLDVIEYDIGYYADRRGLFPSAEEAVEMGLIDDVNDFGYDGDGYVRANGWQETLQDIASLPNQREDHMAGIMRYVEERLP